MSVTSITPYFLFVEFVLSVYLIVTSFSLYRVITTVLFCMLYYFMECLFYVILCRTIALVATVICWLYPTLNKFYLILSCPTLTFSAMSQTIDTYGMDKKPMRLVLLFTRQYLWENHRSTQDIFRPSYILAQDDDPSLQNSKVGSRRDRCYSSQVKGYHIPHISPTETWNTPRNISSIFILDIAGPLGKEVMMLYNIEHTIFWNNVLVCWRSDMVRASNVAAMKRVSRRVRLGKVSY